MKVLEMKSIGKHFGPVCVLSEVDLDLNRGEVLAIIGANGAGKSTLMKILNGIYVDYEGEIVLNGRPLRFQNPVDAFHHGLAMIHQELDLVTNLSVSENIFLGREIPKNRVLGTIDRLAMRREAQALLDELNFPIAADELVGDLSPANQQLVLIARIVAMNAAVVVMDEPTSSLSITEIDYLFSIIRDLKSKGISVIYISHYLEEIFQIADRVLVLRDGRNVATREMSNCTQEQLVEWMVGRKLDRKAYQRDSPSDETVLSVRGLSRKKGLIENVSFDLKKGEVLGIAGVVGSGRTELARLIFGADERCAGEVLLNGERIEVGSPEEAIEHSVGFVPEDRKTDGLVLKRSVGENLAITALRSHSRFGVLDFERIRTLANELIAYLGIRCSSPEQEVGNLSGGNQQKTVIGKWLRVDARVLILDQPTRGVDVGAKEEIYELVNALALDGTSIIFISDELEELIALADRILVMKKGRIVKEVDNAERKETKADLLTLMVGQEESFTLVPTS